MIGQTISHYKVIEKLGEGGMGEVFLAEDTQLDRKVALKFLPPQYTEDPEINARFKREAKAAAALNHPNIITIHEIGEHEGKAFIAMEYVAGQSLRKIMDTNLTKLQQFSKVLDYASQICEGLNEAHQAGIVHRDIKPDNILLDAKGRVKIADFGLAKAQGRTKLTEEGSTMGTLNYMSPEQLNAADVDHRSDIWSFGVVLYEMITDRTPFEGDYDAAVSYAIMHEEPEPLARYKTAVSDGLQRILDKALDKEKETRYQNISDLLTDLKREKKSSSGVVPAVAIKKDNSKRIILASALIITVIVVTLLILNLFQRESKPRLAMKHEQITFTGKATYPAVSPDGYFIAYVADGNKLLVQDLSNAQTIELLKGSMIFHPVWSPDGSEILVTANIAETEFPETLIIPRLGGKPRKFGIGGYNCWAFDGTWIAVAYQDIKQIHLINKNTKEKKNIPISGFQWLFGLDWSEAADQFLILAQSNQKYSLWTIRSDGSDLRMLIEDDKALKAARWSADGNAIYFFRNQGLTVDLVRLSLDGETQRGSAGETVLISGLQVGGYFTMTVDGKQLLYTRALDYSNLWLTEINRQSGDEPPVMKQLTQDFSFKFEPNISPGGKWIAYGSGNVYKIPIDGGESVQLTFSEKDSFRPVWSPDGRSIAYFSSEGGEIKLWTMGADGANPRKYDKTELGGNFQLTWAPGGKILYQIPGLQNFYFLDPKTEKETPLVQNDSVGYLLAAEYAPDSKKVAVFWNRLEYGPIRDPLDSDRRGPAASGLWVISLDDSSQNRVSKLFVFPIGWSPDGKTIYSIDMEKNILMNIPLDGSVPTEMMKLKGAYAGADMSPDGEKFVVSLRVTQSDIWLMENFDPSVKSIDDH